MNRKINTKSAPAAIGPYTQAVMCDGLLFVSGQLPLNAQTNEIAGATIEEQARQVMENLKAILIEAKMSFDDVVKTTCFLSDMQNFPRFNEIYSEYFTNNPARSCVAVKEIPKGVLCEVEIIAHK